MGNLSLQPRDEQMQLWWAYGLKVPCGTRGFCGNFPAGSLSAAVPEVLQTQRLFSVKKEVAKGNSILEISLTSFRILCTPTLPRKRSVVKGVDGGEMLSRLLSQ